MFGGYNFEYESHQSNFSRQLMQDSDCLQMLEGVSRLRVDGANSIRVYVTLSQVRALLRGKVLALEKM